MYLIIIIVWMKLTTECANGLTCEQIVVTSVGTNTLADLISNLSADFAYNRSLVNVQSKVTYKQTSFSDGKNALFKNNTEVQPVFSTAVFQSTTLDEKLQYPDVKSFPVLAGAIVLIFNIPGVKNLTLSLNVTSQIYRGLITHWNDARIQALNPDVRLPNAEIQQVVRSDTSGETDAFTDGLSKGDDQWRQLYGKFDDPQFIDGECCNSTKWASGVIDMFGYSITGMIGIVLSIPYTIGYTAYPNAVKNNLSFAALVNSAGRATLPTVNAMQSAMDYFLTINGGFNYELSNAKNVDSYPMAAFIYFMVNMTIHPSIGCCEAREFVAFVDWLIFTTNDSVIADFGLVKLSPSLSTEIQRSVLQAITCRGEAMYSSYLTTFIKPSTSLETWVILVIAVVVTVAASVTLAMLGYLVYLKRQKQTQEMNWFLPVGSIQMQSSKKELGFEINVDEDGPPLPGSSSKSGSSSDSGTLYTNQADRLRNILLIGTDNDVTVFMDKLEKLSHPMMWKRQTKRMFKKLTEDIGHRNVLRLRGATMWDIFTFAIFENCNKGTLHYVLQTCKYNLTDTVKFNLAMDVIDGLKFLHSRNIIHGFVNSLSCLVESSWNVKVGQWHRHTLYEMENPASLQSLIEYQPDKLMEMHEIIELLYIDQATYPYFNLFTDTYSLGLILIEIFTKKLPYNDEVESGKTSYPKILETKFIEHKSPPLPHLETGIVPEKVEEIIKAALQNVKTRPNIRQLGSALKKAKPTDKGIVDAMMEIIENHAESLEQKTIQLQEVTQRMQELLHEVLPPQIADKLFQGELVPPESFENATVCFADIVGFTVISARSSPQEVMSFLNDIWTSFDSIIQKFDVYKVDTIGDAYMVCSGLPMRNGTLHCKNIASLSLALMDECENFTIFHIPNEKVQIRVGVNTGPVTAGIVGSKMPQYCVFGDAVNTAARMQTTSLPMKIQLSESSYQLLNMHYKQFEMQARGDIEVKGKGLMKTYWLEKETSIRYEPLSTFSNLMTQSV